MQTEIVPFPAGVWEGAVSLRCDIGLDEPLDKSLLGQLRGRADAGVQLIWVNTRRWGDPELDRFMLDLGNDERLSDFLVTAIRPLSADRWSDFEIDWIIDISEVFSTREMDTETIVGTAAASSVVPRMREIIWREPPIGNVNPRTLEAITDHLNPTMQAWLYLDNDALAQQGFRAASRAHALWAVRGKIGASWPATM